MGEIWPRVKAGIFIMVAVGVGVGGFLWLREWSMGKRRYHYVAVVPEASWINPGTIVTMSGVAKGRVDKLELYPESVLIYFWVEDYPLREGAKARVENQGVMGERRLEIYMGTGDTLPEGTHIRGESSPTIGDLVDAANSLLLNLDSLSLEARNAVKALSAKTDALEARLNRTLAEADALMRELRAHSKELAEKGQGSMERIDTLVATLDSLATALQELAEAQGTVQRLATDDKLYKDMEQTLREIRDLVRDIRANPKKYIHISIF